jgi:hypothetical protein
MATQRTHLRRNLRVHHDDAACVMDADPQHRLQTAVDPMSSGFTIHTFTRAHSSPRLLSSLFSPSLFQVANFLRLTRLTDSATMTDDELAAVLTAAHLRVCTWDSTLSLAHPKLSTLLDDLDDRLRRYVRYYHLDDADYTRKEEKEFVELEDGQQISRQRRMRAWQSKLKPYGSR